VANPRNEATRLAGQFHASVCQAVPHVEAGTEAFPDERSAPELVFALVSALGSDLDSATEALTDSLHAVGYRSVFVHLSKLLRGFDRWKDLPLSPLDKQIETHQRAGNELREATGAADAMAVLAIGEIQRTRDHPEKPLRATAYIIRSLKRPEEVETLRRTYGSALFVLALNAPRKTRRESLARSIMTTHGSGGIRKFIPIAEKLIGVDEAEPGSDFGQDVRDTFPAADVFLNAASREKLRAETRRFVEIVFSHPFRTPTPAEFAMFHAQAAAWRSAELGRQVGAAITNGDGQVLAVGANEVPRTNGGQYWEGDEPDGRDFARGENSSQSMRLEVLSEILQRFKDAGWLNAGSSPKHPDILAKEAIPLLKKTRLMNLHEFGRAVHAEMAALLDAARRGIGVDGGILYTTTFPCHNCTKHIVAAGIRQVRFIEPYPESLASRLHDDSVAIDPEQSTRKVSFCPFIGVSPRRYGELFSMTARKGPDGLPRKWKGLESEPRTPDSWFQMTIANEQGVVQAFTAKAVDVGLIAAPPPAEAS
jgi:deoxycytidylate deaminase